MPKTKKETMKDKKRHTSKETASKRQKKSVFKFDTNKILRERGLLKEKPLKQAAYLNGEIIDVDEEIIDVDKKIIDVDEEIIDVDEKIIDDRKMPKTRKETMKDKKRRTSKKTASKRQKKSVFKFDTNKILKERGLLKEKSLKQAANLDGEIIDVDKKIIDDEEMIKVDKLYQESMKKFFDIKDDDQVPLVLTNSDYMFISPNPGSNFDIPFKINPDSDLAETCLQRLQIMSVEEGELEAHIHFNLLRRANWSPVFYDIRSILCEWRTDLDTLTSGSSLKYKYIGRHNFELVINFIVYCIKKNDKTYSVDELLKIAKYAVTLSLDKFCGLMSNVVQELFCACIETALEENNDPGIIASAEELFSKYNVDVLLNMMVVLFLPLIGKITEKMYTYLAYKLFKSLLGQTDNTSAFPSSIKEWFIQDLVDENYFKKNPKKVLSSVISLLEQVVHVFYLYEEEEKMQHMYDFLYPMVNKTGFSSMDLFNKLEQWRLRLFRIRVMRIVDSQQ